MTDLDERFMSMAIRLAARGLGKTSPNPAVGAVVVRGGAVVGEGYHHRAGEPHAEVLALRAAGKRAQGATLYVTLEPCCHTKKRTPPCTPAILSSGVARVVAGMLDPNPRVKGKGIRCLEEAGISVTTGVLEADCERLNEWYVTAMSQGRPFVILKVAATLDGKIAAASGESQWITGEEARRLVHRLRGQVDAVLVGAGTVRRDNPSLTARFSGSRHPLRVVVDSRLTVSPRARVFVDLDQAPTLVATLRGVPRDRVKRLRKKGVEVCQVRAENQRVSLKALMERLVRRGINSLMIEGGSEINASALGAGVVDKVWVFLAPRLMGGKEAKGILGGHSPQRLLEAVSLRGVKVRRVGEDILVEGYVDQRTH